MMEAAADYFLMLNTVPTSQRHPSAGEPLFRRLAAACLRRAELPADFTSWEDADEDRDTFVRFREQILADLLDNCQAQMRSGVPGGGWRRARGGVVGSERRLACSPRGSPPRRSVGISSSRPALGSGCRGGALLRDARAAPRDGGRRLSRRVRGG